MELSEIEKTILMQLGAARGQPIGMPVVDGASEDDIWEAIERLVGRIYVRVIGPSNAHSPIGQDVEELHLTPIGAGYLTNPA